MSNFCILGFDSSAALALTSSIAKDYDVALSPKDDFEVYAKGKNLDSFFVSLKDLFGTKLIVGNIYKALLHLLKSQNLSLSVAESCTGGLLASKLTAIAGASEVFKGSITAYSIATKVDVLKVPRDVIETFGVYSEECVSHMARCSNALFKTNLAIATSGICSPIDNLPYNLQTGNVFIAVLLKGSLPLVSKELFSGTRIEIQSLSCKQAIRLALMKMLDL
ncbi:CinA family protein [Helicobacter sp. 11S02629-2]|uniref:CinA family protein n=1 Tax=Helicobacter sp. 11S02629-2 TaxID=1476195 RepID=UPI000BA686D4|nr:CinA family protein [Helicobacter sp. 11S02629-2]PAF44982.1 hypothetical protein BKH40_04670 [Helicobacter sp. 11S02629-2]